MFNRRFLRFGLSHMSTILLGLKPEELTRDALERIQAIQPAARLVITAESREIEPILDDVEIAAAHFPIQMIPRAPNLRWFQQWGPGTDWLMRYPDIASRDFILTNASGVHSVPISEHNDNERALNIFIDNLERYTLGKPMKNVVDKKRGY
jgi:hypothetical protein